MTESKAPPGLATRQANKERRKQRILAIARELIASEGFDALKISELAKRSGVTIPTVHNLFGKKNDIVIELFRDLVGRIDEALTAPELDDPIDALEAFLDKLLAMYGEDEVFYRAAFLGGERLGLFEHEMSDGVFRKSLKVAERLTMEARERGHLQGRIDQDWMAEQLFNSQRMARQDWVSGYIDLARYRQQALIAMLMTYAADATPEFHQRLCRRIEELA